MTVYEAIKEMRALTQKEIPFSFSFMSFNSSKQTTQGVVQVHRARLRARGVEQFNSQAEIMEEYLDLDLNEPRHFYHPTLMTFNGKSLTLT